MKDFTVYLKETGEVGYVQSIVSSIFYVSGLPNARLNELVISENGLIGIVRALHAELVEVMVFEGQSLGHNMKVVRTDEFFKVPVSDAFLGRIIDPFGVPQDNRGIIENVETYREMDPAAPAITERVRITKPLETGVTIIDTLFPIGQGQRELLLGDQKVGKSTVVMQAIVNQAKRGVVCIYASIGKKKSDLKFAENYLREKKVLEKVAIVAASSSDPTPMVYLAPFSAISLAEYFRDKGRDVLVVFDDLTTHAKFYRELSLLSRRPPGRQSYPGDIFHLHARLAERAGNFKSGSGKAVSITLLPVAETLEGDLSGYIQTNLMAMTDGHLFFDVAESKKGRHPAVSLTLSVSRVGNQTRTQLEREIADTLTRMISVARRAEELGKFGVELTPQTAQAIALFGKIEALLNQESSQIFPKTLQKLFWAMFLAGPWQSLSEQEIKEQKKRLHEDYQLGKLEKVRLQIEKCQSLKDLIIMANNLAKKPTIKAPISGQIAVSP